MTSSKIKCNGCPETFWPFDSVGSNYELCQECWEKVCDREWWRAVQSLQTRCDELDKANRDLLDRFIDSKREGK